MPRMATSYQVLRKERQGKGTRELFKIGMGNLQAMLSLPYAVDRQSVVHTKIIKSRHFILLSSLRPCVHKCCLILQRQSDPLHSP